MPTIPKTWTGVRPMPLRRSPRKVVNLPRKPFTLSADSPLAPGPISLDRLLPPQPAVPGPPTTTTAPATAPPEVVSAPAPLSSRRLLLGR